MGLLAIAASHDLRRRTIPNWISAALALLWVGWAAAEARLGPAGGAIGIAALVLTVGYVAWLGGFLGGGDVKLLAATALWAGTAGVATFLLATAVGGGVLALAVGVRRRIEVARERGGGLARSRELPAPRSVLPAATASASFTSVPYAAAILAGAVSCWLAAHPF